MVTVTELWKYPVKSCQGISVKEAQILPHGFANDRIYMLMDNLIGKALTQRDEPKLAAVSVADGPTGFVLCAPGMKPIVLPYRPSLGFKTEVKLWDSMFDAFFQDAKSIDWFAEYLGMGMSPVLLGLPEHSMRQKEFSRGKAGHMACHDSSPLSILSVGSAGDLNLRLANPVIPLESLCWRFRPNIIIDGCSPHDEDGWNKIRIGSAILAIRKKIPRCGMIETDQATGKDEESGLLAALAKYRKGPKGVEFGVYAYPELCGAPIKVGDAVEVIE